MTKVYFIAGATRGIGFNIAKILAQRPDVKVIATARNVEAAKELAELKASTGRVEIVQLDVSSEESIDALDAQLKKVAADGVDVFISNAAIGKFSTILETPRKVWHEYHATNVLGPIFIFQTLYPYLIKKKTRQIVFVSSLAGSIGAYFPISSSAYGQSKAALNYSAKELSAELDAEEFTVVSVHPGAVTTDMGNAAVESLSDADAVNTLKEMQITPVESATQQVKLFDDLSREQNGKFLNYDGAELVW